MGVRYEWADADQIIVNIYLETPWNWHEYHEVTNDLMKIVRELEHPCATVVDVSNIGSLPRDGNVIQILMGVDRSMPANVFASALVGAPYGVMVFMNMLTKLSSHAKRMVLFSRSIPEAHEQILERYRQIKTDHPS